MYRDHLNRHEANGKTYVPLQWSQSLADEAKLYAQELVSANAGSNVLSLTHDPNAQAEGYGENLFAYSSDGNSYTGYPTTEYILSAWVEGEQDLPWNDNGHLTQVLWRATEWVGCADASSGTMEELHEDGWTKRIVPVGPHFTVCRYARAGNCNMPAPGEDADWLTPTMADTSICGTACHPNDCPTATTRLLRSLRR